MTVTPNPTDLFAVEGKPTDNASQSFVLTMTGWLLSNYRAVIAEFLATFFLMLIGCMACLPIPGFEINPPTYSALAFGIAVMLNIQAFGHISGAHLNPAVTLATVILGKTAVSTAIAYAVAQCAGALLGYGLLMVLSPVDVTVDGICVTAPIAGLKIWQTFGIEVVLTATLVFLCCGVWDKANEKNQDSTALKFGLAIVGLSLAGGPLTGASMNPARSLGPAVWTGAWTAHWAYWAGPFAGSVLAVLFYKIVWLQTDRRKMKEEQPLQY